MAGITNTATTRYLTALDVEQFKSNKIFDEITTGRKSDISVVDKILGFRTYYAANTAREVIKQIGTGVNVTNVANSTLSEVQNQIEELKLSIIALSNADGIALTAGQTNYVNQLARINTTLGNVIFGTKKLFDGTSSLIGSPFNVQVGTNATDVVKIIIERLTTGTTVAGDAYNAGSVNVLFPTVSDAYATTNPAVAAVKAALAPATIADFTSGVGVGTTASIGAIPASTVKTFAVAIDAFISNQKGVANSANGGAIVTTRGALNLTIDNAVTALKTAKSTIAGDITDAGIDAAATAVKAVYNAAGTDSGTVRAAARDMAVPAFPSGANPTLQSVYKSLTTTANAAGLAMFNINGLGTGGTAAQKLAAANEDRTAVNATLDSVAATMNFMSSPYGNLLSDTARTAATNLLTSVSDKLTAIIANISGQQASLVQAKAINSTLFVQLSDAYATYLNANYEVAISALTESDRKITVASLANFLAEKLIYSIIDQLAQAARAA